MVFGFFFTPLLIFTGTHEQFELPKLTLLAFLSLPLLLSAFMSRRDPGVSPLSLALLFFFATQALACLPGLSLSPSTSLWGDYENFAGLSTLLTFLLWYLALGAGLNEDRIGRILTFNSMAALFSALYAVGQHFGFDYIPWNPESVNTTREFAALGNPNFLSAYLAMSIPLYLSLAARPAAPGETPKSFLSFFNLFLAFLGLGLVLFGTMKGQALLGLSPSDELGFITRAIGLLCLGFLCVRAGLTRSWPVTVGVLGIYGSGLFSTGSRGGLLGAVAGVVLWFLLSMKEKDLQATLRQKWDALPKGALAVSSAAILIFLSIFGKSFLLRLGDSILHVGNSLAVSRLHIWQPAVEMIKAHPFFGIGLDNFKIGFPYYSGVEFNQIDGLFMSSRMAHNELLQIAATTGLLGLLAYLLMLGAFLYLWTQSYRKASASGRRVLIAVLAAATAYQVQNLFSFGVAALNLLWFFCLATVEHFDSKDRAAGSSLLRKLGKILAVFCMAGILFFPIKRLAADVAYGQGDLYSSILKRPAEGMDSNALGRYSDLEIHYLTRACGLFPWDVKYQLYLGLAYEQRALIDPGMMSQCAPKALECYQRTIQMSPSNAYYHSNEARVYDLLAKDDPQALAKSEQACAEAARLSPSSPFFILRWAESLRKVGHLEDSKKQAQRAFALDPAFSAKVLSQMAFEAYRNGDKKLAFSYMNEAIQGNPSSAEAYFARGILYLSEKDKKKALADLQKAKDLHPDPYKNPTIHHLDEFIQQASH